MSIGQNALSAPFDQTSAIPLFKVGTRMAGDSGREFVYVVAGGAITGPGYVVRYGPTFSATMLSTANDAGGDNVGVSPIAMTSGTYGWVQIYGACNIQVAASCAANVRLNTTATAGQIDDDGTGGAFAISGAILTTAREASAGLAPGMLNYPVQAVAAL
jgi:hypothetical protein